MNDEPDDAVDETDEPAETALVEVSPGTAVVFGRVPEGLDLIPFSLITLEEQATITDAVAASSSILNVGGQIANSLAQAQGLVRLAPETLAALKDGASVVKSGGWNLGTLKVGNEFSNSVRWLPAGGANAVGIVASIGPAIAMIAIQMQLSELSGLVQQNLELTETVLKSVRHEQWAELMGLEQAVSKALAEAESVGAVTPLLWQNVQGYEAELRKQRDLFRRHVEAHSAELAQRTGHKERRQYIEKSGEAILLDLHSLLLAHRAWFGYQALRAGGAKLGAVEDPREAALLQKIIDNAQDEHEQVVTQMSAILDRLTRELGILAELPGKHTIPFTDARRSARDVAKMSERLLRAVESISRSARSERVALERPGIVFADDDELDQDLRILRWHLDDDERLQALATARNGDVGFAKLGAAVKGVGTAWRDGAGGVAKAVAEVGQGGLKGVEAALRRGTEDNLEAVVEPGTELLIAVTDRRVLVAELSAFRQNGIVRRSIPNDTIRVVRLREVDATGRAELDLITETENQTWRFSRGSSTAEPVSALTALLTSRLDGPAPAQRQLE